MSASYIPYHPEQQQLLPHALQDWLPPGHLAYFISDTIDSLNLSAFHARYAKDGARNHPFHSLMMVKVLVYAYATGVFSSRKIGRKLHEDVAFRVLGADNFPAHCAIREFRALHLSEFTELFENCTYDVLCTYSMLITSPIAYPLTSSFTLVQPTLENLCRTAGLLKSFCRPDSQAAGYKGMAGYEAIAFCHFRSSN